MTYAYRKATVNEQNSLFELYRMVMKDYISEIWGWDEQWQRNDFNSHFNPDEITVVYKNNELTGYSQVETNHDQLFLRMMVIHPSHQRSGIGGKLLRSFIYAGKEQSKNISLNVFKINTAAKNFYEKNGFKIKDETPDSYVMIFNN